MVKVRVPATSANIGPAFDCLGVALNEYNVFEFSKIIKGIEFEGFKEEFSNKNNLVYKSMEKVYKKAGKEIEGIKICLLENEIPISSGLGSSSSCVVAGIFGANALLGNIFSKDELLSIAVEIEGHPDNVAPAILGEMVLSLEEWGQVYYKKIKVSKELNFITVTPNFSLSTKDSRDILPKMIDFKDVAYNISRAAMVISNFIEKDYCKLKISCKDNLHEKYRYELIPTHKEVLNILNDNKCICSFLSGAGPTIIGLSNCCDEESFKLMKEEVKSIKDIKWNIRILKVGSGIKVY